MQQSNGDARIVPEMILDAMLEKIGMTSVEQRILQRLESGPIVSLFNLAVCDLGVSYWWAWMTVRRLERSGRVRVLRRPGYPLVISLA